MEPEARTTVEGTPHPLATARLDRGLSQEALAAAVNEKLSARTIKRLEAGGRPTPYTVKVLTGYFRCKPAALGLVPPYGRVHGAGSAAVGSATPRRRNAEGNDNVRRRELFDLLGRGGAGLIAPGLPDVDWARVDSALAERSGVDARVLEDCAALNRGLWRAFWPASRPGDLLGPALEQFGCIQRLLPIARTGAHHRRLCALVAEAGHLLGVVLINSGRDDDATAAFRFAAEAAAHAEDYDLWAGALVRQAFVPIFADRPAEALPLLHAAARLAERGDRTLPTRYWVAGIAADAHAGVGDLKGCEHALTRAEEIQTVTVRGDDLWVRFKTTQLLEERGASYVTARQPHLAEPALQRALTHWPQPGRRRALILADLARAALQLQEVERACGYAQEVLDLGEQCTGLFIGTLRTLNSELTPFATIGAVRALQEQLPPAA